eukprot:scaffold3538_cov105-Isochrysis_galbana.AAC.5
MEAWPKSKHLARAMRDSEPGAAVPTQKSKRGRLYFRPPGVVASKISSAWLHQKIVRRGAPLAAPSDGHEPVSARVCDCNLKVTDFGATRLPRGWGKRATARGCLAGAAAPVA